MNEFRPRVRRVLVAEVDHAPDGSASTVHVAGKSKEFFYAETESNKHFWNRMEAWAKKQGATHIKDPETKTYKIRSGAGKSLKERCEAIELRRFQKEADRALEKVKG